MKKTFLFTMIAFSSFSMNLAASAPIYVSPTGSDLNSGSSETTAFKTISKATSVVADNTPTTIYLKAGATFDMSIYQDTILIRPNKTVTIIGNNTLILGAEKSQKNGGNGGQFIHAFRNTNLKVQGITFKNACIRGYKFGGAILFEGIKLEVDNCNFIDNEGNSGGAAIGSMGKDVIVTNSYFTGNYVVGNNGSGSVISHCGTPTGAAGSLIIRNSVFVGNESQKEVLGYVLGFLYKYQPTQTTLPQDYTNVNKLEVTNCLFKDNAPTVTWAYNWGADISLQGCSDVEINLVNNTFYNDRALAFPFLLQPIRMINNVFYNNSAKDLGTDYRLGYNFITPASSYDRDPIVGWNNVIIGRVGRNSLIDDPCFTTQKTQFGNVMSTSVADLSQLKLATAVSTDKAVPYLPITDAASILIDKGKASLIVAGVELVPATDILGNNVSNKKDIGSFEFGGSTGIFNIHHSGENLFTVSGSQDGVIVKNTTNEALSLTVRTIDGRTIYNAFVADEIVIHSSNFQSANTVLIISGSNGKTIDTKKILLF